MDTRSEELLPSGGFGAILLGVFDVAAEADVCTMAQLGVAGVTVEIPAGLFALESGVGYVAAPTLSGVE